MDDAHHHHHDETIRSAVVTSSGDLDVQALDRWLGELVRSPDVDLLRVKGVVAVRGQPARFVFQVVRDVVDVRPGRPWGVEPRTNQLVFIGRGLDAEALRAGFEGVRAHA